MLHASYDSSYQHLHRESSVEISNAFTQAIQEQKPKTNQSKIISIWEETRTHIENTFFPGYCTWWAALASPEFFPFTSESTQQRTRWGNAVDRCSGANATGYKIWSNPSVWALIVYKWTSNNGYFWHVWKVMYLNNKYESMIIRDMNWLSKYTRTDRREDTKNTNIKCYIYPKKNENITTNQNNNDINQNNDKFNQWNTWTNNTTTNTGNNSTTIKTGNNNVSTQNNNQTHESAPIQPIILQEPENNNFYYEKTWEKEEFIIEQNQNFSDITNHFLSQNEIKIKIIKNKEIYIWDTITLQITIINKTSKENYVWILPFILNSITQNSILESSLKTTQFIHDKENYITFTAKEKWSNSIIVTIDDQKILTIPITIE